MAVELSCVVRRGRGAGTLLTPHRHGDGMYVVSLTRFARDYVRVRDIEQVMDWARRGYNVRMSNAMSECHRSPCLVCPDNIDRI